jgi:hypothetical protein
VAVQRWTLPLELFMYHILLLYGIFKAALTHLFARFWSLVGWLNIIDS